MFTAKKDKDLAMAELRLRTMLELNKIARKAGFYEQMPSTDKQIMEDLKILHNLK